MEAIAIPMPLWWRLWGRLYAFAVRLIPREKQQTRASDRTDQMAADALDTYGNAILRCAYSYLHNMADAEEVLQDTLLILVFNKTVKTVLFGCCFSSRRPAKDSQDKMVNTILSRNSMRAGKSPPFVCKRTVPRLTPTHLCYHKRAEMSTFYWSKCRNSMLCSK